MSGDVRRLPEANIANVHSAVCHSQPALSQHMIVSLDHNIDLSESKLPYVLPTNSTGIVFALFHADTAGWQ